MTGIPSKNKKLTLGVIFLMLLILVFQLINLLSEDNPEEDKFEFTGAYFELQTPNPETLKRFYIDNMNFYPLKLSGDYIANESVRIKFVKSEERSPQKLIIRVRHLSRLFRKLLKRKIAFTETKHLDENDFLRFAISDPDGNKIIFIEE